MNPDPPVTSTLLPCNLMASVSSRHAGPRPVAAVQSPCWPSHVGRDDDRPPNVRRAASSFRNPGSETSDRNRRSAAFSSSGGRKFSLSSRRSGSTHDTENGVRLCFQSLHGNRVGCDITRVSGVTPDLSCRRESGSTKDTASLPPGPGRRTRRVLFNGLDLESPML
jgi:hypothetical protein